MCKECESLGYIEVIYDDGEFIEGCGVCQQELKFIERQTNAQAAALKDGYVLSESGKILDFKYPKLKGVLPAEIRKTSFLQKMIS